MPLIVGIPAIVGGILGVKALIDYIMYLRQVAVNEGYEKASSEFDGKFKRQYEDFMSKAKTRNRNKQEYEELIKAYETYLDELKKENEDLKKNGMASVFSKPIVARKTTIYEYSSGLEDEIQKYERCFTNLIALKEEA